MSRKSSLHQHNQHDIIIMLLTAFLGSIIYELHLRFYKWIVGFRLDPPWTETEGHTAAYYVCLPFSREEGFFVHISPYMSQP